ncbi:flippase-like domain-containing protein [bacterium]|nr:flippase-like domain-containing protein [bacterium]
MKKFLFLCFKVLVSAGLIYFAVYKLNWAALRENWQQTEWLWLATSVVFLSLSYFLGAMQWQWILRIGQFSIGYWKVLGYYYVGLFFNSFLISGMGGDFMRIYDIRKHSVDEKSLSPALASVFFDRFLGLFTLIFLAGLTGAFVIGRGESPGMFFTIIVLLAAWILVFVIVFNKKIADRTIKPLFKITPPRVYERLERLYYAMNSFKTRPDQLIRIFGISLVVQCLRIFSIWSVGRALNDSSSLVYYVIFVPIISLAASLPISIGGTGPREQTAILLFKRIGLTHELAFSIGFITYIIGTISALPGAAVFLLRKSHYHHD